MPAEIRIIASQKSWLEGEATRQLENTAKLPGMVAAIGMPDLHPGRGHPVGAVFLSEGVFYPYLIGNDIGCGMSLYRLSVKARKAKVDRWVKRLTELDGPWEGDAAAFRAQYDVSNGDFDDALGTIGGGNHFAELLKVEKILEPETYAALELERDNLFLLVHSGSRGLGEKVLRDHTGKEKAIGIADDGPEAQAYLQQHDDAKAWAKANRALIAARIFDKLGMTGEPLLEIEHNTLSKRDVDGRPLWIHRKGAAPNDAGMAVVPGSRGDVSYLVSPARSDIDNGWSIAHGAGRRYKRSEMRGRLNCKADELVQTPAGNRVICENKDLLFEEAPQAYKKIESVIYDLETAGLIAPVARLQPIITYKTRSR